jgi:hypothetical protein
MPDELKAAKTERERLRIELAAIAKERATAGAPVAVLERAEQQAARETHEASIALWHHSGRLGPRPREGDIIGHTSPELSAARRAAAAALPELERLAAKEREIRTAIEAANALIVDFAAETMTKDFEALAVRATALREELSGIEATLAAGYHFFDGESDTHFAGTGRRNQALILTREAAFAGLGEETVSIRNVPMPDRAAVTKHRDEFAQLQE